MRVTRPAIVATATKKNVKRLIMVPPFKTCLIDATLSSRFLTLPSHFQKHLQIAAVNVARQMEPSKWPIVRNVRETCGENAGDEIRWGDDAETAHGTPHWS